MTYREWCEKCKGLGWYRGPEQEGLNCVACEGKGYVLRGVNAVPAENPGLREAVAAYKQARDEAARIILAGYPPPYQWPDYEDDVLAPLRHAMYRAAGLEPERGA